MNTQRPQQNSTDHGTARASVVNRTRRIVREQATVLQERRRRSRDLWVPLAICSTLLLVACYAIWSVMANYDLSPTGVPDASDQMLVLLLWSLPVSVLVLGLAWVRRRMTGSNGERTL